MYLVLPPTSKLLVKVKKHNLSKKLAKALALLAVNPDHPSLHTELLEPKNLGFYSFRIDLKYRGIFIIHEDQTTIQIVGITVHYH